MLCCVSKRAAAGTDRESRPFDESRNFAMLNIAEFSREIDARFASLQKLPEEDVPDILLPCAICDRTFRPESLDKHARICERSTNKKRKPFDSAKQRIKGTDLAEFLPKQNPRNPHVDDRPRRSSAWKKSRDEFLRAIRAAKGETVVSTPQLHRPSTLPVVAAGAPTRAHEKGTCPTCNRQFGIKAYERHVAWCKERSTRLPASPAPNVAKERLEARVKYRAPMLKNRRAVTREKYSPSSTHPPVTTLPKTSTLTRTKENSTSPTGANKVDSSVVRKTSVTRRPVQTNREAVTTHSGPLKPRAMDRSNRSFDDQLPVTPKSSHCLTSQSKQKSKHTIPCSGTPASVKRENPKINDVSFNIDEIVVSPCNFRGKDLVTWKQISAEGDRSKVKKEAFRAAQKSLPNEEDSNVLYSDMNLDKSRRQYVTSYEANGSCKTTKDIDLQDTILHKRIIYDNNLKLHNNLDETFSIDDSMDQRSMKSSARSQSFEENYNDDGGSEISDTGINRTSSPVNDFEIDPKQNSGSMANYTEDKQELHSSRNSLFNSNMEIKSFSARARELQEQGDLKELSNIEAQIEKLEKSEKWMDSAAEVSTIPITSTDRTMNECVVNKVQPETINTPLVNKTRPIVNENIQVATKKDKQEKIDERKKIVGRRRISKLPVKSTSVSSVSCPRDKVDDIVSKRDHLQSKIPEKIDKYQKCKETISVCKNENPNDVPTRRLPVIDFDDAELENVNFSETEGNSPKRCSTYVIERASVSSPKIIKSDSSYEKVATLHWKGKSGSFDSDRAFESEEERLIKSQFKDSSDKCFGIGSMENLFKAADEPLLKDEELTLYSSDNPDFGLNETIQNPKTPEQSDSKSLNEQENIVDEKVDEKMSHFRDSTDTTVCSMEITKVPSSDSFSSFEEKPRSKPINLPQIKNIAFQRESKFLKGVSRLDKLSRPRVSIGTTIVDLSERSMKERKTQRFLPKMPGRTTFKKRSSGCNEYNPFLLAEQQLNDLFSDTSDQSSTDGFTTLPKSSPASQLTLNHSQAFVKYPSQPCESPINASEKRASVIAPPSAFDDLTSSDLSSDFTENSASPENLKLSPSAGPERKSPDRVLGRRLLIDKSEALGEKPLIKVTRPLANRSHSVRSVSAPKAPERNKVSNFSSAGNFPRRFTRQRENGKVDSTPNNDRSNNNYTGSNGSSLSLNSIMSSDVDAKRSNFLFDELLSSFEEDTSGNLPSLRSLLKNDSLSLSSNLQHGKLNGTISDDELSSPESYKRQEVGKINADSAYSSLNRKYSNHDRDQNDAATSNMTLSSMGGTYKMSKFCHECGSKFPELAKFCCECGIQRLTITS